MSDVASVIASIRKALAGYVFRVQSEADLQEQVSSVLATYSIEHRCEVISGASRFDILVTPGVVIELKLRASAASVERQAQRYALLPEVAAVAVVTTSARLAANLAEPTRDGLPPLASLGGKPFHVIALRTS